MTTTLLRTAAELHARVRTGRRAVVMTMGALHEGHATLIRAPAGVRAAVDPFEPQAPALAALTGRVKRQFDPKGLFNPGRMYRGV